LTEIPEHLLKRAAERRAALEAKNAEEAAPAAEAGGGAGTGGGGGEPGAAAAPAEGGGESGGAVATLERTQRLLTVVKAGSIQDVKATPTDKVNVWPHLLVVEFAAALAMTAFLTLFSIFVNAPLLQLANPNLTPNPSKAPWYFLGLQEMLTMFHPMVAGVTIPGIALGVLGAAGYIDKNPSQKPEDRKFAIALFTFFMMFWAVLVLIGSFFRGEGQNFILPWRQGVHDIFDL
jgi:menaquinol-cytochrome c reductase cytochrome b/c subunit